MAEGKKVVQTEFQGKKFTFFESIDIKQLIQEVFSDCYHVIKEGISFSPGDVVVDLGANEGVFSVFMSVLHPEVRIVSLEPVPRTYAQLLKNIELNGCKNIEAHNLGVGKRGQYKGTLIVSKDHSGGSTSWCTYNPDHHDKVEVNLMGLDELFAMARIDRCRLMKVDIEGMEYETFYSSKVMPMVDYLTGEFHINAKLEYDGRRMDGLCNWLHNQVKEKFIHVNFIRMAE